MRIIELLIDKYYEWYYSRINKQVEKAFGRLGDLLVELGYPYGPMEQPCECHDHALRTISVENQEMFTSLMNILSAFMPRELGECTLSFSNCNSTMVINRIEEDEDQLL